MSNQEPTKQTSSTENLPTIGGTLVKDPTVAGLLPESYVARHRALAAQHEKDQQAKAAAEANTEPPKSSKLKTAGKIAAGAAGVAVAVGIIGYGMGNEPGGVTPNEDQLRVGAEAAEKMGQDLPQNPADLHLTAE